MAASIALVAPTLVGGGGLASIVLASPSFAATGITAADPSAVVPAAIEFSQDSTDPAVVDPGQALLGTEYTVESITLNGADADGKIVTDNYVVTVANNKITITPNAGWASSITPFVADVKDSSGTVTKLTVSGSFQKDATDPGTTPTDPTTQPTNPTDPTTDPGTTPTDPGTNPTDPGTTPGGDLGTPPSVGEAVRDNVTIAQGESKEIDVRMNDTTGDTKFGDYSDVKYSDGADASSPYTSSATKDGVTVKTVNGKTQITVAKDAKVGDTYLYYSDGMRQGGNIVVTVTAATTTGQGTGTTNPTSGTGTTTTPGSTSGNTNTGNVDAPGVVHDNASGSTNSGASASNNGTGPMIQTDYVPQDESNSTVGMTIGAMFATSLAGAGLMARKRQGLALKR